MRERKNRDEEAMVRRARRRLRDPWRYYWAMQRCVLLIAALFLVASLPFGFAGRGLVWHVLQWVALVGAVIALAWWGRCTYRLHYLRSQGQVRGS